MAHLRPDRPESKLHHLWKCSRHAISRYGDTRIAGIHSKFGGASIYFDGSGDYLSLPASSDWAFGTGDFTVDVWASFSGAPGTVNIIGPHTSGYYTEWSLLYEQGNVKFFINGISVVSYNWALSLNNWHHLAVTRAAGTLRLFVNGNLVASVANTSDIQNNRPLTIGAADNPALFFSGFLDEIRINKGTAAWTSNFTPPTSPYPQ